MTISTNTRRVINLLKNISEIVTGVGTTILGYNDEWRYACAVMVVGYAINKVADLIYSDAKITDKQ